MKPAHPSGFTLIEVLAVAALIAVLAAVLVGGLGGSGESAAIQGAQTSLANLLTVARTQAAATGRKTRLLLATDPIQTESFLRRIVLQLARESGPSPAEWDTIAEVALPDGAFVLPAALGSVHGLVESPGMWKRESDRAADICSDLFQGQTLAVNLPGEIAVLACTGVAFTPNGTLAPLGNGTPPKGYLVVAGGNRRPPGSFAEGESPVVLRNPDRVRGIVLSAYGVPALVDDRRAF